MIKPGKTVLTLAVVLACALAVGEAPAKGGGHGASGRSSSSSGKSGSHHSGKHHHRHSGSTVFYGGYWPWYWPGMGYALAPGYAAAASIYYVEKSEEELQSDSTWFYCEYEATYYPYVRQCPGGWVRVAPF